MDDMKYAQGLSRLIQVKTVSGSSDEVFAELRSVMDELFPNLKAKCEFKLVYNNAILIKLKGKSDKKPIVLMAHQDVVPAEDGEWKYPPFSGTIADGRVWGRGAMDCKNTLFAAFQAIDELCAEGYVPEYDVYIASSDSEEVFGEGAPKLKDYLKENGVKPYIVLDEGGAILAQAFPGMIKPYAMVGVLEKGYADFKFTAKSKGGHSSSPPKNSPIARLSAFVNEVENSKFFKKKMAPEAKEMLSKMAGGLTGPLKTVLGNINLFKPLIMGVLPKASPFGRALLSTTCVFTMSGGSEAPNVIPQEAFVIANLRFAPHQGVDACAAYFKKLCAKYDLEMETLEAHDALPPVSTKSEGYKHLVNTIGKCFPEVGIAPYVIIGGTDCRYFQEICDCAMRFAPMLLEADQLASMHSSNESLNVVELGKGIAFMKELIKTNV